MQSNPHGLSIFYSSSNWGGLPGSISLYINYALDFTGDSHWDELLNNHKEKLISQLVMDCNDRGLKYINWDLEYPESAEWIQDILNNTKLMISLYGFDIKVGVAAGSWSGHLGLYAGCSKHLDWIELMCYDNDTIIESVDSSHKQCLEMGFDKNQIFVGVSYDKNGKPDNDETIKYKEKFVNDNGLKGLMYWH